MKKGSAVSRPAECPTAVHEDIDLAATETLGGLRDWIKIGSFSDTGEGMKEGSEYAKDLVGRVAADAAVVPTAGYPVVFGTYRSSMPDAPTLVIYGLYDVTPTRTSEWSVDPLAATIVDARDIGLPAHLGQVVVGRGANNHKGPIMATLGALRCLVSRTGDLPVNLVFVIEGEEEIGSPSLSAFVEEHRTLLASASGVWLPCMQQSSTGVMALRRSYKGALFFQLACEGGAWGGTVDGRHLWAGHSVWIDSPLMYLVRALASLYDEQQRPCIDGLGSIDHTWADEVAERRRAASSDERPTMLDILRVKQFMNGRDMAYFLPQYMLGTTLNVEGVVGGYQGPSFYTMLPGSATAYVDLRFPPGVSIEGVLRAIRAHLDARGFKQVKIANARGYEGVPHLSEKDDTLLSAAKVTAKRYGVPLDILPCTNNCSPGAVLSTIDSQVPFSVAGMGHGERAHAPDEYCTVGSIPALMHWTCDYLYDWAATVRDREAR